MMYIMKKIIPALFLCFICLSGSAIADIRVLSSGPSGITLSYRPEHVAADSLQANGKVYLRFSADGHTFFGAPGYPSLPSRTALFSAPENGTPTITISGLSRSLRKGVIVSPHPRLVHDKSGFTRESYTEDPVQYALSGFRPSEFVLLGNKSVIDGVSIWELVFQPVLFDAGASTVSIADSFIVAVSWGGTLSNTVRTNRIPEQVLNRDACISQKASLRLKTSAKAENPFASGDWYRIAFSDSGMFKISGSELEVAGFPIGSTGVDAIRMYYGGGYILETDIHELTTDNFKEIAIKVNDVNGDGIFGRLDSIVFYGEALTRFVMCTDSLALKFQTHPYSTSNICWLTISQSGIPKRMTSVAQSPSESLPARTEIHEILHLEREVSLEYPESGINWYWDSINGTLSKSFTFNAPGVLAGDSTVVRISFLNPPIDLTGNPTTISHSLQIWVNDTGPFSHEVPKKVTDSTEFIYENTLNEKNNYLKIRRKTGGKDEVILLDWLEIEYTRKLEMKGYTLEFFLAGDGNPVRLSVANAPRSSVEVYDTSDPYDVSENVGKTFDVNTLSLSFQSSPPMGRYSRYTLCDPNGYRKVTSITRKTRSDLRNSQNGADYVVITHSMFLDEAKKLADWRSRDSENDPLQTMVVNVTDIYDEFGWGVYDPTSIRDYLKFARENYTPGVRYCCFIGDATYKYKNISSSQTYYTMIPTFESGNVATDDFYTWNDNTQSPQIAIGRLCVNTVEEAKTVVDKIIEYERTPENGVWNNRVLLIADDETGTNGVGQDREFSFDTEKLDVMDYIPQYLERMKIMQIEYPLKNYLKPEASEAILKAFDDGCVLSNYIGHGNKNLLAHEHVLVGSRDIERFNNAGRQSLFIIGSCSVGDYDRIDTVSLAELMHLRKGGGCIGVIAASRETFNASNVSLMKEYYTHLFGTDDNPEYRIGLALKQAKQYKVHQDVYNNFYNRLVLFGDPATQLRIPRYRLQAAPIDTLYRLEKMNLSGTTQNSGKAISYSGSLHISAEGPRIHKRYMLANGLHIDYTMPGKVFYRGEVPISGSEFATSLVAPKDLTSTTDEARIYMFANGDTREATGILDDLYVGAISPGAPEDTAGPDITLAFDGKAFDDGDYIRRQPTLSAVMTDPSGLNVYGNRGHNVTVTLDKTESYILTDEVRCVGSYTTGETELSLPLLTAGEHVLDISVYDTYNNVTKKEVTMHVIGSDTGDITIRDLLNYPNPMRTEGTTFTFNLTDDAASADIKIYSQSGRLVDTLRFSAEYGFNRVFWKPSTVIANGVYFYKLSVRSSNGRKQSKIEKLIVMR